ncbi:MAG: 50S ribosomal protein L29 [Candidatus Kaelpia imicola]|nr:50S ribosomal protein L29 [Candidatus Kaelpia imicola]
MKVKDLRNMTDEELNHKLEDLYDKLLHLRSDIKVGKLQKPHEIGVYRSDIAKIHTVISERSKKKKSEAS